MLWPAPRPRRTCLPWPVQRPPLFPSHARPRARARVGRRPTRTAGAYGSTKRYKSFERIRKVNDVCVLGASGELSDFQYIMRWAAVHCRALR